MVVLGVLSLQAALLFSAPPASVAYDGPACTWLLDPAGVVSRNDVVYASPSFEPWEAMPVGGGDLSAMVRCDGQDLHLHLTKSDAWGFQAPPDAPLGSRFFNNVSPGHVRITLGPKAKALAEERFVQRLDLYHGKVHLELGEGEKAVALDVWGHPERKILVVEIADPARLLDAPAVELSEWRDTMKIEALPGCLAAREVHTRPARPHLAASGMEDYFGAGADPLEGRGTAVVVGPHSTVSEGEAVVEGQIARLTLPKDDSGRYGVLVSCEVTPKGDPGVAARRTFGDATATPLATLRAEHEAWWGAYWSRSFLRLESDDPAARWLTAAFYVHLYTLGCVNRGAVPAKWDGGPGLMRGDERTWGLAEWVQEVRFTYLPLYAANQLDMAKGLTNHYTRMQPFLLEQTRRMWGLPGLWIPETVLPWGSAEDWVLREADDHLESFAPWAPATAPYGKFERYNRYIGFLFACGPELCWHYLAYYGYSGDEAFLEGEAYPVIRGVAEFLSGLLRKGDDGCWHLDPANALETWWMVRDPADAMDGIRWLFGEFTALAERFGRDSGLRATCEAQLAALPGPPIGLWHPDGTIDAAIDAYAPAAAPGEPPKHCNFENPALYRVFPFGLSGIGTADHGRAVRTFEQRIFSGAQSWSMDAIWAARLGLRDEACTLLAEHTRKWNRFRYGGWDSGNSSVFPDGLAVAPYIDGAGVACYALQEILLQSHNGIIRVLPAVSPGWSGVFRLRAQGGFLVGADFNDGRARFVEVKSLLGGPCRVANPWDGPCVVRHGGEAALRSEDREIRFDTAKGEIYLLEPEDRPLDSYDRAPIDDKPNQQPGLPGRDGR